MKEVSKQLDSEIKTRKQKCTTLSFKIVQDWDNNNKWNRMVSRECLPIYSLRKSLKKITKKIMSSLLETYLCSRKFLLTQIIKDCKVVMRIILMTNLQGFTLNLEDFKEMLGVYIIIKSPWTLVLMDMAMASCKWKNKATKMSFNIIKAIFSPQALFQPIESDNQEII